jgi:hypothetical protein
MASLPKIDPEFIVICQSAWCNESGIIKHGWEVRGSDDFNIAQTYGDDLIWFGWMDQRIDEDEDTMREIAEAVGLTFDPRWYRLELSRADGRVIGLRSEARP